MTMQLFGRILAEQIIRERSEQRLTHTYDSDTGDDLLCRLAASLSRAARPQDLQGRWDKKQFVTAAVLAPCDASFVNWTHRQRRASVLPPPRWNSTPATT